MMKMNKSITIIIYDTRNKLCRIRLVMWENFYYYRKSHSDRIDTGIRVVVNSVDVNVIVNTMPLS